MDIFDKIQENKGPFGQYKSEAHGYFTFPKLRGEISNRMVFRGKEVLNWSLPNYLGLANHPMVRKSDTKSTKKWGLSYPLGARILTGQTMQHTELEHQLADFTEKKAAYVLNSAYQGMLSIIDALIGRYDVVIYDNQAHASVHDGARFQLGRRFSYSHNDVGHLQKQLERASLLCKQNKGGILVVTEGVFGISGEIGKLREIVELKKEFSFRLLVNDSEGFGTMGKTGAGTGEALNVQDQIDLYFSSFSHAIACPGAFVAGDEEVIDYLNYNLRSELFGEALSIPVVRSVKKRIKIILENPQFRQQLWSVVNALQTGLKEKGFDIGTTQSPITPILLDSTPKQASNIIMELREHYNIFCSILAYPAVPKNTIMLRLMPTAAHTLEDVEHTISAFANIQEKLLSGEYDKDDDNAYKF